MSSFSDYLDRLWEIQQLDRRIIASREQMAAADRRVTDKQTQLDKALAREAAAKDELRHMQSREHEIEDELKRLDARIKQIEFVPGSEAALEKHRADIGELEGEGIELLTAMADKRSEIDRMRADGQVLSAAVGELKQAAESVRSAQGNELLQTQEQRAKIVVDVPDDVMRVYDGAAQRHPGAALARASGDFCAACSGELTMHLIVRARTRTEFVRCPHCARILDPVQP